MVAAAAAAAAAAATSLIGDQLRYEYTAHAQVLFSAASVKGLVANDDAETHTANDDADGQLHENPIQWIGGAMEHHGIPDSRGVEE